MKTHTHTHTTFTKMWNVKTFHLVETKVEKLQNTVGSFQFGAFHIWPFHILGTYFDHSDMGDSSHLIGRHVLGHNSRTRVFLDMRFFAECYIIIPSIYMHNMNKIVRAVFEKNDKNPILTPFLAQNSRTRIFFENRAPSLFSIYGPLTSCKNSEKSLEPLLRKLTNRLTD